MERVTKGRFKSFIKERMPMASVCILVYRFVAFTGGTYDGVSPDRMNNDRIIPMRAVMWDAAQEDVLTSSGLVVKGDLKTLTVADIVFYQNKALNLSQGDLMKYNGRFFYAKGMPRKTTAYGGRLMTETLWGCK
jgi:hypothetical protein